MFIKKINNEASNHFTKRIWPSLSWTESSAQTADHTAALCAAEYETHPIPQSTALCTEAAALHTATAETSHDTTADALCSG